MWKKVFLNVFYNVGVIFSGMGVYWSFTNTQYLYAVIFAITAAFFIYQKIRLLKEVKSSIKK